MKVLITVHGFFPEQRSGTEVLTLELARGLIGRGHHVEVLTGAFRGGKTSAASPWLTESDYHGITVHRLNYYEPTNGDPIALHSSAPARTELVMRVVARMQPDIVHINHLLGLSSEIVPAIRRLQIPVVYSATDFWAICPHYTLLHKFDKQVCSGPAGGLACIRYCVNSRAARVPRIAKMLVTTGVFRQHQTARQIESVVRRPAAVRSHVNASNMIISATQFLANTLVQNGIDARLMRVIPYGVDIGKVGTRLEIPSRFSAAVPLRLAFMGTLAEHKGVHVLLDALAKLGDRAREISLRIYGDAHPDNPYWRDIRANVERSGGTAVLAGTFSHDAIGEVMTQHHLLVVPSLWYESTPLVLCSALAAGIPAIVSRLGGMTEIIEEDVNGLSFAAGDATALKEALLRLLDSPELLAGLHRTTLARRRFTTDYARDIESAYFEVRRDASVSEER